MELIYSGPTKCTMNGRELTPCWALAKFTAAFDASDALTWLGVVDPDEARCFKAGVRINSKRGGRVLINYCPFCGEAARDRTGD